MVSDQDLGTWMREQRWFGAKAADISHFGELDSVALADGLCLKLAEARFNSGVHDIYQLLTRADDDKEVCEVTVYNPRFLDQPLRQVEFPGDLLILAVRRQGELVVPHGDTRLNAGDQITLVGSCSCVDVSRKMLFATSTD